MIIVEQEKDLFVNFNNVAVITLSGDKKDICAILFDNNRVFLGTYKTEERAREVLEEMYKWLMSDERFNIYNKGVNREDAKAYALVGQYKIFRMPKE